MRAVLVALAAVAVLAVAGLGLWRAGEEPPRTLESRTTAVAAELGCPTCEAQSVATSRSEIAAAMRAEIRAQLAAGRTPEQVRVWFAARYGPDVLLEPPAAGIGLVLWLAPLALLGGGLVLAVAVARRRGGDSRPARAGSGGRGGLLPVAAVAVVVMVAISGWLALDRAGPPVAATTSGPPTAVDPEAPEGAATWLERGAARESHGAYREAAEAYRRALELRPGDVRAQVRLGLVLLRAGEPARAEEVARRLLGDRPAHPEGLLVLGLAQRARDLPTARATLQRFLDQAPGHPAASEVRRLLGEPGG